MNHMHLPENYGILEQSLHTSVIYAEGGGMRYDTC